MLSFTGALKVYAAMEPQDMRKSFNGLAAVVKGRLYEIEWTTNLLHGFEPLESGLEYPQARYDHMINDEDPAGFYKINVRMK